MSEGELKKRILIWLHRVPVKEGHNVISEKRYYDLTMECKTQIEKSIDEAKQEFPDYKEYNYPRGSRGYLLDEHDYMRHVINWYKKWFGDSS